MTDMRDAFDDWFDMLVIPADVLTGEMDQDARVEAIRQFTKQAWSDSRKQGIVLPAKVEFDQYISTEQAHIHNDLVDDFAQSLTAQGYTVKESNNG